MEGINWLAIIISATVPMLVGFVWYNPKVFGKVWMESIGMAEEDEGGNMAVIFGVSYLLSALIAYVLSMYMGYHDEAEQVFTHGMFHGGYMAVFIGAPVLIINSLFERRNWTCILINAGYWVLSMALMGGVTTLFL